LLIDMPKWRSW